MNISKTASGRKSANRPYSTEQTIPSSEPSAPVYPLTDGPLSPTFAINLMAPKVPPEFMARPQMIVKEAEVKSPVRHEVQKKAALPIPSQGLDYDELERLRRENAQLRAEIQRLNEERTLIINDYEDKIRALRQNTTTSLGRISDTEKNQLLEEIGKLRAAKMSLEHQLEGYNMLLRERDELNRIIESLKYQLAELDAANRGNASVYGDLETLRALLKQRDNEAAMREAEFGRLIMELNELRGKSARNNDLALILFMIEIERLHSLLSDRSAEMQQLVADQQADLMAFERQLKESFATDRYQLEMELTRLRARLADSENRVDIGEVTRLQAELERSRTVILDLQRNNEALVIQFNQNDQRERVMALQAELSDKTSRISLLTTEIERFRGIILDLQHKNEALAIQFTQNDQKERILALEIELQQLRFQYAQMEKEVEAKRLSMDQEIRRRLEIEISQLRITEKAQWELKLNEARAERQGYENRIILLSTEIERINGLNRKLTEERDWYSMKLKEVGAELDRVKERPDMQNQVILLGTEIERLNQIISVQTREAEAWRAKYSRLEMAKFEELQMIISQNAELSKRMSVSAGDSERVMRMFKDLEGEHTVLWSKYQAIAQELEHMRMTRDSYIGPAEESPRKTALKQNIITKIHNIGSENVSYEQNLSPQKSFTNEIRFSSTSGQNINQYY